MAFTTFETSLGTCAIAWSDVGVTYFQLPEESPETTRGRLLAKCTEAGREAASPRNRPTWVTAAIAKITDHLEGRLQALEEVPLDFGRVTAFDAKVYTALRAVRAGTTTTYGALARDVGSPGAARAVGRAMATNPFALLVPCHRVLTTSGRGGGFSAYGGLVTKEKLLSLENAPGQISLFAGDAGRLPFDAGAALTAIRSSDAVLGRLVDRVGPFTMKLKATEDTFEALAESIVYQQLTGKAAATIFARVRALYPRGALSADAVLATSDERLRAAGLSTSKRLALKDLARRTLDGGVPTLRELARMEDERIVERLTQVRGIGRWTVEMLLIFRLGRPDVLPLGDYGIRKGFARVFPKPGTRTRYGDKELPSPAVLEARGDRWRPFRSVASWYLWRALELA